MTDQPMPSGGEVRVPDVLSTRFTAVLKQQTDKGIRTYGQPVMTWNGREAGQDALEEWLDLGIYVTQLHLEHKDLMAENAALRAELARLKARLKGGAI